MASLQSNCVSPRSPGQLAGELAQGLSQSTYGNIFGRRRGGSIDHRTLGLDVQPGLSGLHRGRGTSRSPSPGTKFSQLAALKALDISYLDLGIQVLPARRHTPSPQMPRDCRNMILQNLDAHESTAVLGRRAALPRAHLPRQDGSVQYASPRHMPVRSSHPEMAEQSGSMLVPPVLGQCDESFEDKYEKGYCADSGYCNSKFLAAKKADSEKTMRKSLRRLDSCAAKLEKVAQALVQEAQRQSLKRVA